MRISEHWLVPHDPWQPKVAQLHIVVAVKKNVSRLKVSMQNLALFTRVTHLESLSYLRQNDPDHILRQLVFFLSTILDHCRNITAFTELHDHENLWKIAVYYPVVVPNNVWVMQFPQNVYFWDQHLLFFFWHLTVIELFPDENASITFTANFANTAEASLANFFDPLVFFELDTGCVGAAWDGRLRFLFLFHLD